MRTLVIAVALVATAFAQEPLEHRTLGLKFFEAWGDFSKLSNPTKIIYLEGFISGAAALANDEVGKKFVVCASKNISYSQGFAMIDKFHRNNPEKWRMLMGQAILLALAAPESPCAAEKL